LPGPRRKPSQIIGPTEFHRLFNEALEEHSGWTENQNLWPEGYNEDTEDCAWAFVRDLVLTWDDERKKVHGIPNLYYLEWITRVWHRCRAHHVGLTMEKSRRIVVSWLKRGLNCWDMGLCRSTGVVTGMTFDKSCDFVWRIAFIYRQIRHTHPEYALPDCSTNGGNYDRMLVEEVIFPNGSKVEKMNQDSGKFQGSGYSWIDVEEPSLYRDVIGLNAQAVIITSGSGEEHAGSINHISNANPFNPDWIKFRKISDQKIPEWLQDLEVPPYCSMRVCENGYIFLDIDFRADPAKNSDAYINRMRQTLGERDFSIQMMRDYAVSGDKAVWADFKYDLHAPLMLRKAKIPIAHNSQLIGAWDIGTSLHPAFALGQVTEDGQIQAVLEVDPEGSMATYAFAHKVLTVLKNELPGRWDEIAHYTDPAATARMQSIASDEFRAAIEIVRALGFYNITTAPTNEWAVRERAMVWALTDWVTQEGDMQKWVPRMVFCERGCPVLVAGMKGNYKLETIGSVDPSNPMAVFKKPLKNMYSHINDAWQIIVMVAQRRIGSMASMTGATRSYSYVDS
jgi:hypothetical protein